MENPSKILRNFVKSKIIDIVFSRDEAYVRASLARLRRGIGKPPGSIPDIWEHTLGNLPEEFFSKRNPVEATNAEWAIHIAMSLFALHQQGKNPQNDCMAFGKPLGKAVRLLVLKRGEAMKRRFDAVVTSGGIDELSHHLCALIQLLKSEGISLDYPQLTEDLFRFQQPELRGNLRLQWGQDYYKIIKGEINEQ